MTETLSNPKQHYGDLKVPMHLVPPTAIAYLAMAFGEGARKYGAYNYRDVAVETMTYLGAVQRHVAAYLDGEDIDPDSGLPHLALAMACLAIIADGVERDSIIDNRPVPGAVNVVLSRYAEQRAEVTDRETSEAIAAAVAEDTAHSTPAEAPELHPAAVVHGFQEPKYAVLCEACGGRVTQFAIDSCPVAKCPWKGQATRRPKL